MKTQASKFLTALGIAALLAVPGALAQTINLVGEIPFDFYVGNKLLPEGKYTVATVSSTGAVAVRSFADGKGVLVFTISAQAKTLPGKGKLIFHRYGDRYFLSQMWMPGNHAGRELPPSKAELETARTISQETGVEVAANVKR